jgi:hypothetical protein
VQLFLLKFFDMPFLAGVELGKGRKRKVGT